MGAWVAAAAVALSAFQGQQGAKAAKKAGKASAAAIMTNYREERRRAEASFTKERSLADLAIGASNLQKTGSALTYTNELAAEQARQLDWMRQAAEANARAARKGGSAAASSLKMQAGSQMLSTAASWRAQNGAWGNTS
jgi:hypothetical protein